MDLMSRVQESMALQLERLSGKLAEKYVVPKEELSGDVAAFLRETYGPALEAARALSIRERPVVLSSAGKTEPYARCASQLERFLQDHEELDPVLLYYAKPEGLSLPHDTA